MEQAVVFEDVLELVNQLPARDKVRLIAWLAQEIERELWQQQTGSRKSLRGLGISAEEIDQARREEWTSFPRGDV